MDVNLVTAAFGSLILAAATQGECQSVLTMLKLILFVDIAVDGEDHSTRHIAKAHDC